MSALRSRAVHISRRLAGRRSRGLARHARDATEPDRPLDGRGDERECLALRKMNLRRRQSRIWCACRCIACRHTRQSTPSGCSKVATRKQCRQRIANLRGRRLRESIPCTRSAGPSALPAIGETGVNPRCDRRSRPPCAVSCAVSDAVFGSRSSHLRAALTARASIATSASPARGSGMTPAATRSRSRWRRPAVGFEPVAQYAAGSSSPSWASATHSTSSRLVMLDRLARRGVHSGCRFGRIRWACSRGRCNASSRPTRRLLLHRARGRRHRSVRRTRPRW